ncbi:MAG: homoserine dehydrogenase [Acidobacteriota bacterium]|nr:homoserine dehydrogenase [Acidobacteriota bacterium]
MKSDLTRPIGVGLIGFGTVGRAFARLLTREAADLALRRGVNLSLVAVGTRGADTKRDAVLGAGVRWTSDLASVATDPRVDVVVELLGGIEPANGLIRAALGAGKSVVTANKMLLAKHGTALQQLAREKGAGLGIEASVAGGIPILRALRSSFTGDRVTAVSGILNGTCNFILTEMEATGRPYADVLEDAQRLGYAEADPASDVEGDDAAYKLALLARLAFGRDVSVDQIAREGITRLLPCDFVYAKRLGRTPRQLAVARVAPSGRLLLSVRTHFVSEASLLAKVTGPFNAVEVRGESGGPFVFSGRGAGGDPTATAVLADVVEIARGGAPGVQAPPLGFASLEPCTPAAAEEFVSPFYLRFIVKDRPGILADLARILAEHGINIDAVFQAPYEDKSALPFVVTLEPVSGEALAAALVAISSLDFHVVPPLALPMTE